jgi:hypothetical protein
MKPLTGFLLLGGVAVAVGIGLALESKKSTSVSPAPTPSPQPPRIPPPGVLQNVSGRTTNYTVSYLANGTTAVLNVGDRINTQLLILPPGQDWAVISSDPTILVRDPDSVHAILPGEPPANSSASDWFLALQPGSAVISGQQIGGQGKFALAVRVS